MMILLFPIVALLVPPAQIWLLRLGYRGNHRAIALLMFVPGIWLWLGLLELMCSLNRPVNNLGEAMYFVIGMHAYVYYVPLVITTVVFAGIWRAVKQTPRKKLLHPEEVAPVPKVRNACATIFAALTAATLYLGNYATIEDAVKANDLDLVRRRLSFNLLGRGPNDGGVGAPFSSGGQRPYPLLPIAVYHGNREMVDLLLEHGAHPTPRHWKGSVRDPDPLAIDNGDVRTNTLYYAMKQGNWPLFEYLLDKGADPSQGLSMAVDMQDKALVALLVERGGNPNEGIDSALVGDLSILGYLLEKGADRGAAVEIAVGSRRVKGLAYLMTRGVELAEIREACGDCTLPLDELEAWIERGCDMTDPWIIELPG